MCCSCNAPKICVRRISFHNRNTTPIKPMLPSVRRKSIWIMPLSTSVALRSAIIRFRHLLTAKSANRRSMKVPTFKPEQRSQPLINCSRFMRMHFWRNVTCGHCCMRNARKSPSKRICWTTRRFSKPENWYLSQMRSKNQREPLIFVRNFQTKTSSFGRGAAWRLKFVTKPFRMPCWYPKVPSVRACTAVLCTL